MIIRVQSKQGTKRLEIGENDTVADLFNKIRQLYQLDGTWRLFRERNKQNEIVKTGERLNAAGLGHGDMIYLDGAQNAADSGLMPAPKSVREDDIDVYLWKQNGRINRGASDVGDDRAGSAGMFKMDDLPIEPWDEGYLKEKEIKFLSFHAFMRQQTAGVDKGKYFRLEKFKAACKLDPSKGKHSAVDLPSAVTLNRQKFRHVDNIVFENKEIVDRFLNYWRKSGCQRMGYLYGKYASHGDVPLGIKAEVCAIYEPPQQGTVNSLKFFDDPHAGTVDAIAQGLGLQKVGWIVTDLVALDRTSGKVCNFRNPNTHFLTAEECVTAAKFQNEHPNPCRLGSDGFYGSKFATVVVSGDKDFQISFEGYQVSNQCMTLVADDCLVPTLDAPELGYIRESSSTLFVSDVYYKEKDKYGNEITKPAQPLPLEYLLTDVPTAFSRDSQFTVSNQIAEFVPCNRDSIGQGQSISALGHYFNQFHEGQLVDALCDFNLLVYLATNDTLSLKDEMQQILKAARLKDREVALECSAKPNWMTLQELMKHAADHAGHSDSAAADASGMDAEMREAIERSLQVQ